MIALGITLYIVLAFITTVIIMVTDEDRPKTDPSTCLAIGLFWPVVALVGLFVGISKLCKKLADWIIEWRTKK